MTEPLQVGQFGIVDHEPVDRGPNAGFFQGKGPAEDRAELFVVAEGTTPAGEAFAGHVVSAVGQVWGELDMSVTGALRRVFAEAARNLDDWNRKSIAQHRVSLGMSCFAHRGDQAILAQAGPTIAFHLHEGRLRTYTPSPGARAAIGTGGETEPELLRLDFGPADRLLLVSTVAAAEMDEELIAGILALPGEQALQDLYHRLQHLRHATVLLVTGRATRRRLDEELSIPAFEDEEAEASELVIDATGEAGTAGDGYQPSLFINDEREDEVEAARRKLLDITARLAPRHELPAGEEAGVAPLRRVSGETVLAQLAAERRAVAAASHRALTAATATRAGASAGPGLAQRQANDEFSTFERRRGTSFTRSLGAESRAAIPDAAMSDAPLASELAEGRRNRTREGLVPAATVLEGASALAAGGAPLVRPRTNMGGRWRGGGGLSGRGTLARQQLPPTWLVIVVGLGLLLTLVAALTVPGLLEENRAGDAAALVDQAQEELATALVQEDPAAKRAALTRAQALLLEAEAAGGQAAAGRGLVNEVAGAIADLDAVHHPAAVESLADLSQFGTRPVTPSHIVAGGGLVYLLDTASAQVIAVDPGSGATAVVYAAAEDASRARPLAIAYLDSPEMSDGALLIVDANRGLWALGGDGQVRPVLFNLPAKATVTDIAGYAGDLYVLDAANARVLRMSPAAGEFGRDAEVMLESPELAKAARLMYDGEVVTSDGDGTLHRFSGQLWLELSQAGIDRPVTSAQAPQSFAGGTEIAVLEPEADRIIVLLRDGTFARQYQDPAFATVSAFGIGPQGEGYVFAGGQLRRVSW